MKNNIRALFIMMLFALPALAQKKFSEGTISYDIVINTGSDKPKNADFLDGTTVATYVKGPRIRTEMVSPLGTMTTIHDSLKNAIVILKEFGEQKYMITLTPDDWKDVNRKYEGIVYTFDPTATKTILGYTCKKAVGKLPDGTTYTVWYTPDLVAENNNLQYETRTLPGLALEYEVVTNNQKVTYTVSKISFSPVPASKFDLPKAGYRVMTYAESKGGKKQ
jgi:GLPGLI family protein